MPVHDIRLVRGRDRRGHAGHIGDRKEYPREDDVHDHACGEYDDLDPARLIHEAARALRTLDGIVIRILPEDLHEPAERYPIERVQRFAHLLAPCARRESEAELIDADARFLGGIEMPKLVHEHEYCKDGEK